MMRIDRAARRTPAPQRRLLVAIHDRRSLVDGLAAGRRLLPACDLRSAIPATITWGQPARRGIYGGLCIAALDKRCAYGRLSHGRMAKAVDGPWADRHEPRPSWHCGSDGPRVPAGLIARYSGSCSRGRTPSDFTSTVAPISSSVHSTRSEREVGTL